MRKLPVKINDKKMPIDSNNSYKVVYDYRKRNSGGFADAFILGTIMMTGFMWLMLFFVTR